MNPRGQPTATLAAIEGIYRAHLPEFRRAVPVDHQRLPSDAAQATRGLELLPGDVLVVRVPR